MSAGVGLQRDRMVKALESIKEDILDRFPTTEFQWFDGFDPPGLYLRALVETQDSDEVVDVYVDRLVEFQVTEGLPIYVLSISKTAMQSVRGD